MMKKLLSIILMAVLLFSTLSATTFAATEDDLSGTGAEADAAPTGVLRHVALNAEQVKRYLSINDTETVHEIILADDFAAETIGTPGDNSDANYIKTWCTVGKGKKILDLDGQNLILHSDYCAIATGSEKGMAYIESKSVETLFSIPSGAELVVNGGYSGTAGTAGSIVYRGVLLYKCDGIDQRDIFHVDGGSLTINSGSFRPASTAQKYSWSGGTMASGITEWIQVNGTAVTCNSGSVTINGGEFTGIGMNTYFFKNGTDVYPAARNGALEINSNSVYVEINGGRFIGSSHASCISGTGYNQYANAVIRAGQFDVDQNDSTIGVQYGSGADKLISAGRMGLPIPSCGADTLYYSSPDNTVYTSSNVNSTTFLTMQKATLYVKPQSTIQDGYRPSTVKDNKDVTLLVDGKSYNNTVQQWSINNSRVLEINPSSLYFPNLQGNNNEGITQGMRGTATVVEKLKGNYSKTIANNRSFTVKRKGDVATNNFQFDLKDILTESERNSLVFNNTNYEYTVQLSFIETHGNQNASYQVTHKSTYSFRPTKLNRIDDVELSERTTKSLKPGTSAAENPPALFNIGAQATLEDSCWIVKYSNNTESVFTGNFAPGGTYYPYYVLKPSTGYSFNTSVPVRFTDGYETTARRYDDGTLLVYGPPRHVPNQLNRVDVTFTEPKAGAHPDYTITTSTKNCGFYVGVGLLVPHQTGLEFADPTLDSSTHLFQQMNPEDAFVAGNTYTARIYLMIDEDKDYAFGKNLVVYCNGKKATLTSTPDGSALSTMVIAEIRYTPDASGGNILGDADRNGKVNIFDASDIQKSLAGVKGKPNYGKLSASDLQFRLADVDGNGKVNIFDASLIQKYIAGDASAQHYGIGKPI